MNGQGGLGFAVRLQSIKDALHREQRVISGLSLPLASLPQKQSLEECLKALCKLSSAMDLPKTSLSLIRLRKLAATAAPPLKERVDTAVAWTIQLQSILQSMQPREESSLLNLPLGSLKVLRQKLETCEGLRGDLVDGDFRKLWSRMIRGCSPYVALAQSLPDIANCYAECLRTKVPRRNWRSFIAEKIYT